MSPPNKENDTYFDKDFEMEIFNEKVEIFPKITTVLYAFKLIT